MQQIEQGQILSVEKIEVPVLVVSKDFFNRGEQIIACPIAVNSAPDPLHIPITMDGREGIVLCEQMKFLDLHIRGYKKLAQLSVREIMNITDAIQGIFDYYPYGK